MCGFNFIAVMVFILIVTACYSFLFLPSCVNGYYEWILRSSFAYSTLVASLSKEKASYILLLQNKLFIFVMCLKKDTVNFIQERDLNQ
jgi:hypothetical protein